MSNIAYLMEWEESERGWGTRPDGWSLHLSQADYTAFVNSHWATFEGKPTPDEYDRPVSLQGKLRLVEVIDDALWTKLKEEHSLRFYTKTLHFKQGTEGRLFVSAKPLEQAPTFIELCLSKKANPEDLDAFVEKWHTSVDQGLTLREAIGMTVPEYTDWMKNPAVLYRILFDRVLQNNPTQAYFKHVKSGGTYIVHLKGKLESTLEPVTVYQGLDGQVWVRPDAEFDDGRFQPLGNKN